MNLYFLENYNNYFNRVIKPTFEYKTIDDFEISGVFNGNAKYITGVNFNFQDGITTTQIVNWNESWSPDYMILVNDNGSIHSTWFIMDSYYTRNGQFSISLKRDVINDYYEKIIESPMYVEKATINDINNPLMYNSEGMVFNEIKQDEKQLFDATGTGWIVGYVAKPQANEEDVALSASVNLDFDYTANSLPFTANQEIYELPSTWQLKVAMGRGTGFFAYTTAYRAYTFYGYDLSSVSAPEYIGVSNLNLSPYIVFPDEIENFDAALLENLTSWKQKVVQSASTLGPISAFQAMSYNGKIVYDTELDKYYRIRVEYLEDQAVGARYMSYETDAAAVALKYAIDIANKQVGGGDLMADLTATSKKFRMNFIELPNANLTSKISASRIGLTDAPYDMFAIPYGQLRITNTGESVNALTNAQAAINIAHEITEKLGKLKLYDIQLLPYCPCMEYMQDGIMYLTGLQENIHYNFVSTEQAIQSIICWCNTSSNTFTIDYTYVPVEPKIENECDMWRLTSPNYQGIFEFSAAKNGGINNFIVDYTYKPYNPYIHVSPVWGNLYGRNFGDARGLICGGDFSLPQTSDAFTEYEVTNKNYQNIFDRGIQNLEFNRKYQRIGEVASAFTGSVGTATVGFMAGGAPGAIAGGIAGLGAGLADVGISEALYKENKDYQTDLYNFNLGNVKAMPDSLTKTSALTINNKIVPILEYYSCTEKEKEALRNKLKYNGMTVMAIGQLKDYLLPNETFVKGQLIRIDAAEDNHMATAIFNELQKGVFVAPIISEA